MRIEIASLSARVFPCTPIRVLPSTASRPGASPGAVVIHAARGITLANARLGSISRFRCSFVMGDYPCVVVLGPDVALMRDEGEISGDARGDDHKIPANRPEKESENGDHFVPP